MRKVVYTASIAMITMLSGCSGANVPQWLQPTEPQQTGGDVPLSAVAPVEVPAETITPTLDPTPPPPPPPTANTAAALDTTTAEDKAEATEVEEPVGEQPLGNTLATLGDPTDPGFWMKTPLVSALTAGRIDYKGEVINVDLRPSGGSPGSGSQLSLPAMQLLGAPLTDIVEVIVYKGQDS